MKVATILPVSHQLLEMNNDYHMALAHLIGPSGALYTRFFRQQSHWGRWVMMDNGVVETGTPMSVDDLLVRAERIGADEVVVPDIIDDDLATMSLARVAVPRLKREGYRTLGVPQGETLNEWVGCLNELLALGVDTIGLSKFGPDARSVLLRESRKAQVLSGVYVETHLLGCRTPGEVQQLDRDYTGVIRGVDSGVACFYTKVGLSMASGATRPQAKVDFLEDRYDENLMQRNYEYWRMSCSA